jgi:DegV family protein with EDD domain
MQFALITDSGAIFDGFAPLHQLPLTVVHNRIITPERTFVEGKDLSTADALALVAAARQSVVVEAPSVDAYAQAFAQVAQRADAVVCVCPSRRLSQHHENAMRAAASTGGVGPVKVIDSLSVSAGQTLVMLAIADALQRGMSLDNLDQHARAASAELYVLISVEQVESLARQQILPPQHALFGAMLDLRPIVTMESGFLTAVGKARSRANTIERLAEFAQEFSATAPILILHDHHSQDMAVRLRERLTEGRAAGQIETLVYNPSLAPYVGLGALGIAILEKLHQ